MVGRGGFGRPSREPPVPAVEEGDRRWASTPRMMVASIRMPPPSAVAKSSASVPGSSAKATNARKRISAALDISGGAADPSTTASSVEPVGRSLADPAMTVLGIHRDAEEEREDDDRQLDVDRLCAWMPQIASEPKPSW